MGPAPAPAVVMECVEAGAGSEEVDAMRPLAHWPPDIWGENFVNFTPQHSLMMETYEETMKPLKEEVRKMLMNKCMKLEEKIKMIDAVERLGVYYFYDKEIDELLNQIFQEISKNKFNTDYDLHTTASMFRIFRQHGHNIPCDVFEKFVEKEGKMKECVKNDIKGMVSLYEACHLRVHGETILDEALTFTTKVLESNASVSDQARHALKQVSHFGIQRVESRYYISFYEEDEDDQSRNQTLLKLAKLDFNRLQLLYRQELTPILKWDLSAMSQLPKEYMKIVFQFVYDVYEHFSKEMSKKGTLYAARYAKNCVLDLIRAYHTEAKWYKAKHVPTFDEFLVNGRITGVAIIIVTSSIMGMPEIVDEKPYQLIAQAPKAIQAAQVIGRLMDDIVSHQEEQARGHVATGVECYMKEHNVSREEAVGYINKMLEDAWKEINEEFLVEVDSTQNHLPRVVLQRILELSRVIDALYKVIDGYTYSEKLIKEDIITTYLRPIAM